MIPPLDQIEIHSILSLLRDSFVIITDLSGKVVFTNRDTDRWLKADTSVFDVLGQERAPFNALVEELVSKRQSFHLRALLGEEGAAIMHDLRFSPILDAQSNVTLIFIEAKDISAEQAFSNKFRRINADHNNLIEYANAIIIGCDTLGYITDWNKNCESTIGLSAREVFTKHISDVLIPRYDQPPIMDLVGSALNGTPLDHFQYAIWSKDQRPLSLLLSATPRKNLKNQVDGILLVGHDITELVEYRNSLEEKVKERTARLNESNREIIRQKEEVEKEQQRSDRLLLNIMPATIASELKANGRVAPRHYGCASILFADLVGFTKLARSMKPEQLVHELDEIFVGFDLILERYGLEKIKMLGDGYMAAAGVPMKLENHAAEAVRAGMNMIAFLDRVNARHDPKARKPWKIRIGIHSGELIAGVIGKRKLAYDVWGATVNTASQVESVGKPGFVTISEATYKLVADQFESQRLGPVSNEKLQEIVLYQVLRERPAANPSGKIHQQKTINHE